MDKIYYYNVLDKLVYYGIILFVLSMPISIAACQIFLGVSWLFWLFSCLLFRKWLGIKTPLDYYLLIFLIVFIAASIFSLEPLNSFRGLKKFYLTSAVYLIAFNIRDSEKIILLIKIFVISSAIASLYGLGMYSFGQQSALLGFQTMALTTSGIFAMAGLLAWGLVLLKMKSDKENILYILVAILIFMSLLFTRSLSSWIAYTIGLSVVIIFMRKWKILVVLIFCVAIFIITLGHKSLLLKNYNFKSYKTWSWTVRKTIWETGWEIIKQKPILGHGNIDLGEKYKEIRKDVFGENPKQIRTFGHLHNNFLHIMAITGVMGLLAFCFLLLKIIMMAFKTYSISSPNNKIITIATTAGITSFLINGLAEWNFGDSEVVTVFWFLTGIIVVVNRIESGQETVVNDDKKILK